jgi:aerobic carbon-monoxide dehydrogenase medium subunit
VQVPAHVEYERATSVAQALTLLTRYAPGARVLAGGHSLIPMMKLRLAQPEVLVDINAITGLRYIQLRSGDKAGGELRIGALARHADLLASPAAGAHFAILHDAERVIADPIVRNWGTIGGSLCQADPSEDLSAAFAALKGSMVIHGPGGRREVSARAFHTGPYETVVGPDELLTEIRLPVRPGRGSAYLKVCRRAGDWPIGAAGAAVWLADPTGKGTAEDTVIADVGIGLTAVGAAHFAAAEAEEFLRGRAPTEDAFARAGEIAAEHCSPTADQRGPVEYKRHLVRELTARVLRTAVARAGGPAHASVRHLSAPPPTTGPPTMGPPTMGPPTMGSPTTGSPTTGPQL